MNHEGNISENNEQLVNDIDLWIIGYLTGDIDEHDLAGLQQWLSAGKENVAYFNRMKTTWILSGIGRDTSASTNSWKELSAKIGYGNKTPVKIPIRRTLQFAASFLLCIVLGGAATHWLEHRTDEPAYIAMTTETVIEAPLGSISKLTLPDSSQVWLNAGSTIHYNTDFGKDTRQLELTGEAYFVVKTNPRKPFLVNTKDVTIRALGTKFNVKAYPEEASVTAILEEGVIDVNIANIKHKEIVLKPKEKIVIGKQDYRVVQAQPEESLPVVNKKQEKNVVITAGVNTYAPTSWKDKQWQVTGESVASLSRMLSRRYNYPIVVRDDELNQYKFTGTIENEGIEHILEALRQTAPLQYTIYKDSIVLSMDYANKAKFASVIKK
ncbi:MAG: FecR domain-containing protein [Tannerella sp.]|jgi:ferric-dicitrate binding protein FerR (iron transport regulator)|nr:FecR domain-containing protein [Tannerella sp.]